MNNLTVLKDLYNISSLEDVKALISKYEQYERLSSFNGSRKKGITMLCNFTKHAAIKRETLGFMYKDDDYYYMTDSYILVKSHDHFMELINDPSEYPNLTPIINSTLSYDEILDINTINFNDVNMEYKKDKKSTYDITLNNGVIMTLATKYLIAAVNFLGLENIKVYGNGSYLKPLVFKNDKTGEFVLIMPVRRKAS